VDDETIVAGLKIHDKKALEHFWRNYHDRIYSICVVILGKGPDALDMTVDILVDFMEKSVSSLSSPNAMFSFLRQMAVRRSIRYRDRRNKIACLETGVYFCTGATPGSVLVIGQNLDFIEDNSLLSC
jgi:DNA-directed RNA polymerase specialized sigma24 family protein